MKNRFTIHLLATAIMLLTAGAAIAADSPAQKDKELSYPLRPGDREILINRVAKVEKGMTVKEALRTLQPMRGFPQPVNDVPGNNSFTQDLGYGWSLRFNFANPADGGLLISAKVNTPVQQQMPEQKK